MKVILKYDPENEQDKRRAGMEVKFNFTYQMAPELEDEFDKKQFQEFSMFEVKLKPRKYDSDQIIINSYYWEQELPFGSFKVIQANKLIQK